MIVVRKGVSTLPFQNHPPITHPPHFLKSPIPIPYRQIGHPKFSLLTEMQLKLSSINNKYYPYKTT